MTGQELYIRYAEAAAASNTIVDEWEDLDEYDHEIWNRLADMLADGAYVDKSNDPNVG